MEKKAEVNLKHVLANVQIEILVAYRKKVSATIQSLSLVWEVK